MNSEGAGGDMNSDGAGGDMNPDGMGGAMGAGVADNGDGSEDGFQPCPEVGECKILPLGDSITFGLGFDGGYRVELFRLALSDGHDITFTGTQQPNGPSMVDGEPFPRNHGGISGETVQQINNRIPNPELSDMPHIILVHAGTNDIYGSDPGGAPGRLEELMDDLIAEAPDALIVISNIIPLSNFGNVESYNSGIPAMVQERADAGSHIIFVDQFEGFPTSELGDGVHPNEAGYSRMAAKWYDAIEEYLP
jgi:hypothetical protein